ncbi:bifunctional DNA primase/polymerase [Streptomyces sp. NPDC002130]|uniref:bifunctional DNA primase/polymerase n=1 Tax=Streptomyces sp. NPDC002130 TaxID=3155568 RepID=UPI003327DA9D
MSTIVAALLAVDGVARRPFVRVAPALAAAGLHVFPLRAKGAPLVKWGTAATTDPAIIEGWVQQWPSALVGIACKPSKLLVVDLDVKHPPIDGRAEWAALTLACGDPEARWAGLTDRTTLIKTSSGGLHLWFANPDDIPGRNAMLPGIDVKAAEGRWGGYVMAPGNPGYSALGLKPPLVRRDWLALILTHDDKPRTGWTPEPRPVPPKPVDPGVRESLAAALKARGLS